MTPKAQRIAIAEACGWKNCVGDSGFVTRYKGTPSETTVRVTLPDYLNDLNACHEFEKTLTDPLRKKYQSVLIAEVIGWIAYDNERISIHATAAQRCEAFLRTIGKWKNDR